MKKPLIAIAVWILAGCATASDLPLRESDSQLRERMLGSWYLDVSAMGRRTQEVIRFLPDGSYVATVVMTEKGLGLPVTEKGSWFVENGEYEFQAIESSSASPRKQRRKILKIQDEELIAVDAEYGIEMLRKRVSDNFVIENRSLDLLKDPLGKAGLTR